MSMVILNYRITEQYAPSNDSSYFRATRIETGADCYLRVIPVNAFPQASTLLSLQLTFQKRSAFRHSLVIPVGIPDVFPEGLILSQAYYPGKSLADVLKESGRPLEINRAMGFGYSIVSALAALHGQGIAHGSLSSNHVLIADNEEALVSFLPLPTEYDAKLKRYRHAASNDQEPTERDDVFALGVVLAELFTGLIPYGASVADSRRNANQYYEYYEAGFANFQGFPARDISDLILRCLTPSREEGFSSGIDVFNDFRSILERWTNEEPAAALPRPTAARPSAGKERPAGAAPIQSEEPAEPKPLPGYTIKDYDKSARRRRSLAGVLSAFFAIGVIAGGFFLYRYLSVIPVGDRPNYRGTLDALNLTQTVLAEKVTLPIAAEVTPENASAPENPSDSNEALSAPPIQENLPIRTEIGAGIVWLKDRQEMVYVPGGAFKMGLDGKFDFNLSILTPMTEAIVDSFWIDRTEISAGQYRSCAQSTICAEPTDPRFPADDALPAVGIAWADAEAYCRWAGKRLPTEAEWEKAARGTNGALFPWGNDSPYSQADASVLGALRPADDAETFDRSPYGALSMGGNVAEWTNDFYSENRVISAGMENPQGPLSGTTRTVKGGSATDAQFESGWLLAGRFGVEGANPQSFGFRCAVSAGEVDGEKASGLPDPIERSAMTDAPDRPQGCTNRVGFVADVTPDGQAIAQGQRMTKTWRFRNDGSCPLTEDYFMVATAGLQPGAQRLFRFGTTIQPGQEGDVTISYPVFGSGTQRVDFKLSSPSGTTFGLGPQQRGALWTEYIVQ